MMRSSKETYASGVAEDRSGIRRRDVPTEGNGSVMPPQTEVDNKKMQTVCSSSRSL